ASSPHPRSESTPRSGSPSTSGTERARPLGGAGGGSVPGPPSPAKDPAPPLLSDRPEGERRPRGAAVLEPARSRSSASGSKPLEVLQATGHGGGFLLGLVGDDGLGGEEERRDGGGVLQRRAGHLGGVD